MTTHYKIHTVIKSIVHEKRLLRARKDPNDPEGQAILSEYEDLGWFVNFEGSWEKLSLGPTKPELHPGQRVTITVAPDQ